MDNKFKTTGVNDMIHKVGDISASDYEIALQKYEDTFEVSEETKERARVLMLLKTSSIARMESKNKGKIVLEFNPKGSSQVTKMIMIKQGLETCSTCIRYRCKCK